MHTSSSLGQALTALLVGVGIALGIVWVVGQVTTSQQRSDHALLIAQRNQVDRLAANQAAAQAREAQALAQATAQERKQAIRLQCQQQNHRHDATIRELDHELAIYSRRIKRPAQRQQLAASRQFTVLLIDRLAPKQKCAAVVAQLTQP